MNRREFLQRAGVVSAALTIPGASKLIAKRLTSEQWRTFVVTTKAEILKPAGTTRVWLPAALIRETPFQRTIANHIECTGVRATLIEYGEDSLGIVAARFPAGVKPTLTFTSIIATKDYAVDVTAPASSHQLRPANIDRYLRPTKLVPTDGIVRETAFEITRAEKTDLGKARCIYDWIVENTFREPKVRGCGLGDIRWMLQTKHLGGKCADLNALFVGLARAAGVPARDVYGIRVGESKLGLKSLGLASQDATHAQHCRAEVYLSGHGWVPVDPADVRKAVLEEPPGNRPLSDELVQQTRQRLFGSWEMNWVAFNFAQDVSLPGSQHATIPFFMYPQAETADGRLDSLDPESFRYEITARELQSWV